MPNMVEMEKKDFITSWKIHYYNIIDNGYSTIGCYEKFKSQMKNFLEELSYISDMEELNNFEKEYLTYRNNFLENELYEKLELIIKYIEKESEIYDKYKEVLQEVINDNQKEDLYDKIISLNEVEDDLAIYYKNKYWNNEWFTDILRGNISIDSRGILNNLFDGNEFKFLIHSFNPKALYSMTNDTMYNSLKERLKKRKYLSTSIISDQCLNIFKKRWCGVVLNVLPESVYTGDSKDMFVTQKKNYLKYKYSPGKKIFTPQQILDETIENKRVNIGSGYNEILVEATGVNVIGVFMKKLSKQKENYYKKEIQDIYDFVEESGLPLIHIDEQAYLDIEKEKLSLVYCKKDRLNMSM